MVDENCVEGAVRLAFQDVSKERKKKDAVCAHDD